MSQAILLLPEQAVADSQSAGCVPTDRFPLLLLICCHSCARKSRLSEQESALRQWEYSEYYV